jgi:choline dehydrogenase-like flavoprotein
MATREKVDVVIAGASGSTFAAVLAKAGKKVVLIDNGPDWQLTDLISSDINVLLKQDTSKACRKRKVSYPRHTA